MEFHQVQGQVDRSMLIQINENVLKTVILYSETTWNYLEYGWVVSIRMSWDYQSVLLKYHKDIAWSNLVQKSP